MRAERHPRAPRLQRASAALCNCGAVWQALLDDYQPLPSPTMGNLSNPEPPICTQALFQTLTGIALLHCTCSCGVRSVRGCTIWYRKASSLDTHMTCLQVLRDMKVAGVQPNTYTYAALVVACEHNGDWEQAVRIFRKMEVRFPTPACWQACNAHLRLYLSVRCGCAWHIRSFWRRA